MSEFLQTKEIVEYPKGGKSYFYVMNQTGIIVEEAIKCIRTYFYETVNDTHSQFGRGRISKE